jgi:transcriptional regulator with XRE-family HTH domain
MQLQTWICNLKRGKLAMGVKRRMGVQKLPGKLLAIREAIGLNQPELLDRLSEYDKRIKRLNKSNISNYEKGHREPPIPVLLAYARLAGVCLEVLADPKKTLPAKLPVEPGHKAED